MELFQGQFSVLAYFPHFTCNCIDDILYATLNHFSFWKANSGSTLSVAWDAKGLHWGRESTNGEVEFHDGGFPQPEELSQALLLTSSQAKTRSGNQTPNTCKYSWAVHSHHPVSIPSNQGTKSEFQNVFSISGYQTEEFDSRVFLNAKQWAKVSFK